MEEETIDDKPPCQPLALILCASFCCQGSGSVTAVYRGGTQRTRIRQPPIPRKSPGMRATDPMSEEEVRRRIGTPSAWALSNECRVD